MTIAIQHLGNVAALRTGYKLYSGKASENDEKKWGVLQLRDFDDNGRLLPAMIESTPHSPDIAGYSVSHGDVLFAGRSTRVSGILVESDVPARTAASSHFYIVRPRRDFLEPAYVAWFLNHPATRSKLGAVARGTYIPFVPLSELAKLEIPLPSLETQRNIAAISSLAARERDLTDEIMALNADLRNALTWRAAHS